MTIKTIHLHKLLRAFNLPEKKLTTMLRADIRTGIRKASGFPSNGGDFHCPFWADAKAHVAGESLLNETTQTRISANLTRKRLYPLLKDGFLTWWDGRLRLSNEVFTYQPLQVKARYKIDELDAVVKVENLLGVSIGTSSNMLVYPYMYDEPSLDVDTARLGMWLLSTALSEYPMENLKLLNVIKSNEFSHRNATPIGGEEEQFVSKYKDIISKWEELHGDYA